METTSVPAVSSAPRLRRTLTLWDLILYGVIVIQPVAPMSVFGVLSDRGHGHVVTTILIAMVAMLFTAISYGRMARAYPSAGSAFTYVGQEINPALGYVTGWSMVMDYMLNPMICIIWISQQAHVFRARCLLSAAMGGFLSRWFSRALNIQGVKTSARVNTGTGRGHGRGDCDFFSSRRRATFLDIRTTEPHFFTRPFYDPRAVEHQSGARWHVDCGAYVHWFRWYLDAFGRSRESAAKHFAGHGADLSGDRNFFCGSGLCGTADMAGYAAISQR